MVVNPREGNIRTFDMNHKLRQVLDLTLLRRVDISNADPLRLELVFQEGYTSYCQLVFRDRKRRRVFAHQVLSHAFSRGKRSQKNKTQYSIHQRISFQLRAQTH